MNLHEYQGKALFAEYNLPVSKGVVIFEPEEALKACRDIGGTKWVVKAQVHAGGRGKAGGVKLVDTPDDAIDFARSWLGKNLLPIKLTLTDSWSIQFWLRNALILIKNYI